MKYSELERMLQNAGCQIMREGAKHSLWYSPITGESFPVGRHKMREVSTGTLRSIQRMAGI